MSRWEHYRDASNIWQWRRLDDGFQVIEKSTGWNLSAFNSAPKHRKVVISGTFAPSSTLTPPPPPGGLVRVIGTDFGNSPPPGLEWFQAARSAGYEGAWVPTGSWSPYEGAFWWRTKEVLGLYEAAGFPYLLTYHRPNAHVAEAWDALGEWKLKIRAFCFDVEDEAQPLTLDAVDATRAVMLRDGVDPDRRLWLYSSKYLWQAVQGGDDQRFKTLFQHIAPYSGIIEGWPTEIPPIDLWGGFTQAQVDGLQLRGAEEADPRYFEGVKVHDSIFNRADLA